MRDQADRQLSCNKTGALALPHNRKSDEKLSGHADIMLQLLALEDDGRDNPGTDCNRFTLFRRTRVRLRNCMSPPAKCKRLATMLYAKANRERDPEIRAEWKCIARGYLILANQFEGNSSKDISYASFPSIRDIDEEVA